MKKLFAISVLLAVCVIPAYAADFRVGIVNTERILRESVPALNAEKKIEEEFAERDQEIKDMMTQAKSLQADLEEEAGQSDVDHRSKERELVNINVNLQRLQREFREDLNLRKNEELSQVLSLADKAIQTIAKGEKYDLILQEAVYRNPNIDITEKVLEYLNEDKARTEDEKN
ncbi:MAG: OmpH family outer membrane protein [Gallionellaceae bacterium]